MSISSFIKVLLDLNSNIKEFLNNPKFIGWEYHEVEINFENY